MHHAQTVYIQNRHLCQDIVPWDICEGQISAGFKAELAACYRCLFISKLLIAHRPKPSVPEDLNTPCDIAVDFHSRHKPGVPFLSCMRMHA